MNAEHDYYAALEVAPNATPDGIRAAYYRMVRRHPPEKDADGFRRVHSAFEVLSQSRSRAEYDAVRSVDAETRALLDKGRELLSDDSAEAAIPLKRALVRQPDSAMIRDLLVQALVLGDETEEALKHAKRVLTQEPSNPVYSMRVGDILRALDRDAEALPYLQKAAATDACNHQFVTKLAYLLNYLERPDEAIQVLEKGIAADSQIDFSDFLFFQALCRIYIVTENWSKLEATYTRIRQIMPPDPETHAFVAWFHYVDALQAADRGHYEGAVRSIDEASAIDPNLPELQDTRRRIQGARNAVNEIEKLLNDASIQAPLRYAVFALVGNSVFGSDERGQDIYKNATQALSKEATVGGNTIASDIRRIQETYPASAEIAATFLTAALQLEQSAPKVYKRLKCPLCANEALADLPTGADIVRMLAQPSRDIIYTCPKCSGQFRSVRGQTVAYSRGMESSPCFVVTAVCGREDAYPVVALRAFRDERLSRSGIGRSLILAYHCVGPVFSKIVARVELLRRLTFFVVTWLATRLDPRR